MNLHLRILIGYHALVAILVILVGGAAFGFHQQREVLKEAVSATGRQVGLLARAGETETLTSQAPNDAASRAELEKGWLEVENRIAAAGDAAQRYSSLYGALLVVVLITVAFLSRQLRRGLVDRLVATATVAHAVLTEGDRSRRVHAGPDDELGLIGEALNALLDTEQALQAQMEGRLCQQRQLLLGMAELWPKKVALFTIYGDLAVSSLSDRDREELQAAELKFPDPPKEIKDDRPFVAQAGGRELTFRLLRSQGRRPVGWLTELD